MQPVNLSLFIPLYALSFWCVFDDEMQPNAAGLKNQTSFFRKENPSEGEALAQNASPIRSN